MALVPPSVKNLWREYTASFQSKAAEPVLHPDQDKDYEWFELRYNGRILKYNVRVFGNRPEKGYPLFIGLHGGGGYKLDNLGSNDFNWRDFTKNFWTEPVIAHTQKTGEGAVYISPRGISVPKEGGHMQDFYDIHFQPESYVLFQRMIQGFLLPIPSEIKKQGLDPQRRGFGNEDTTFVDPNRVFLLGFSAGGDGAFQFSARLPDIFGAVNAGGGHPNWVSFSNLTNLPLCIQCGEKDTTPGSPGAVGRDTSGVKDRAREMVRDNFVLDDLRKTVREQLFYTVPKVYQSKVYNYLFYPHDCFIVKDKGHNSWAQPGQINQNQNVLTSLRLWQAQQENPNVTVEGAYNTAQKNINPVEWVSSHGPRSPVPSFVVWDLATRPNLPEGVRGVWLGTSSPNDKRESWSPKNFMYWLYLRTPSGDSTALGGEVRAAYDYATNSVWVSKPTEYLGLLLNESMVDFSKDINVCVGTKMLQKFSVKPSDSLRRETLWARGDPSFVFSAMIYFEKSGDSWVVKSTDTLGPDTHQTFRSML